MQQMKENDLLELGFHKSWMKDMLPIMNNENTKKIIATLIDAKRKGHTITPAGTNIFRAFNSDLSKVKVAILGQDPYPNKSHAIGKAFLTPTNCESVPYSLNQIIKCLKEEYPEFPNIEVKDINYLWNHSPDLFLFNTSLTLLDNKPESHLELWKTFSESVIDILSRNKEIVWMIWGKKALSFVKDKDIAHIYYTNHPAAIRYGYSFEPKFREVARQIKDEYYWVLPF